MMCSIKGSICKLEKLLNIIYAKRKIDLIHAIIPKVKHIFDQHRLCTVTSSVRSEVILFYRQFTSGFDMRSAEQDRISKVLMFLLFTIYVRLILH